MSISRLMQIKLEFREKNEFICLEKREGKEASLKRSFQLHLKASFEC